MSSDAPPSSAEVTTALTCRDSVDVNTFTSSGMRAPARVPHEMIIESFHHSVVSPPKLGMMSLDTKNVSTMETTELIQTSQVSGDSKLNLSTLPYRARAMAPLMK